MIRVDLNRMRCAPAFALFGCLFLFRSENVFLSPRHVLIPYTSPFFRYMKDYGKIHWTYSKDLLSGALVSAFLHRTLHMKQLGTLVDPFAWELLQQDRARYALARARVRLK